MADIFDTLGRFIDRTWTDVEVMVERAFGDTVEATHTVNSFSYKVLKGKNEVTITVEVPGCGPDDVSATLDDGIIIVTFRDFIRSLDRTVRFRVGRQVLPEDIDAKVSNGLLTIVAKGRPVAKAPAGNVTIKG